MTKSQQKQPEKLDWTELLARAEHVRYVLINEGKTEAVRFNLSPVLDTVELGAKNPSTYMRLKQQCAYLEETYYMLFFPEDQPPVEKKDEPSTRFDEPKG